ncbi:hypothetical protein BH23GEM7_BH23GEM7_39730 [soil metagenome]
MRTLRVVLTDAPSPGPSPDSGGGENNESYSTSPPELGERWRAPASRRGGARSRLPHLLSALVPFLLLAACATTAPPERRVISTPTAPAAVGPYSQAIQVGNTLYVAGQIAIVPATGELIEGGIEAQTRQALENIRAILQTAGFGLEHVVQAQVFLADLNHFAEYNRVYAEFFPSNPPARATVQAARIPRDALVEIMVTAVR